MTVWKTEVPKPKAGLAIYFDEFKSTEIDTAGVFQDIEGAFVYTEKEGFISTTEHATYTGEETREFTFTWSAALAVDSGGHTIHIGMSVNSEVLGEFSPSVMGTFVKYSNEVVPISGSFIITLVKGDTLQFRVASDFALDVVKFEHFTGVLNPLY